MVVELWLIGGYKVMDNQAYRWLIGVTMVSILVNTGEK